MKWSVFMHLTIQRVTQRKERLGAAAFNVVAEYFPYEAKRIRGTMDDSTNTLRIRRMAHVVGITDIPVDNGSLQGANLTTRANKTIDLTDKVIDLRESIPVQKESSGAVFELVEFEF